MRLCELEPGCVGSRAEESLYDPMGTPVALRADVVLRRAWLRALRGELAAATADLAEETRRGGACRAAPGWCRHLLQIALRLPPPGGTEALAIYLEMPDRLEGPDALELARAAAAQAEQAGAPLWAANLLASVTGRIPEDPKGAHLLHIAQLYLAGGDRVRADEVLRFAGTRLPRAALTAPGWTAVARALRARPGAPAPAAPAGPDPDLAGARAALDAARLASLRKGTTP
jgi:hypothetical protein